MGLRYGFQVVRKSQSLVLYIQYSLQMALAHVQSTLDRVVDVTIFLLFSKQRICIFLPHRCKPSFYNRCYCKVSYSHDAKLVCKKQIDSIDPFFVVKRSLPLLFISSVFEAITVFMSDSWYHQYDKDS